ncbi:MAG: diguanylate cyclase, partial [Candidatus Competibacteraceae bacterium]|nr:diguanylate cyclase [Candidatus Competibacteraceae bacterium]
SLMTATACRILGNRLSMKNLEELFLAGLLQGIGVLALSMILPESYGPLLKEATEHLEGTTAVLNYQRLAELERERLGDDHAAVGAWLMQHWRLPEYLTVATAGSLNPNGSDAPDRYQTLVQSVALAMHIADIWTRPHDWQHSPEVAELAQAWFGLNTDHYLEILEQVGAKFPEIAALFQIKALDAAQIAGILDQAREALDIRSVQRWPERINRKTVSVEPSHPAALPNQLPLIPTLASARNLRSQRDATIRPSTGQYAFDALTGLLNQFRLNDRLQQELTAAKKQNWPLSVALLDVDDLKKINKSCGHGVGDQVLVALARLLRSSIRRQDITARYQDDAFALVLPTRGIRDACNFIKQLMEQIRGWEPVTERGQNLQVTISVGLGTYPETGLADCQSGEQLLEAAHQALRSAQEAGGGQFVVYRAKSSDS